MKQSTESENYLVEHALDVRLHFSLSLMLAAIILAMSVFGLCLL